MHLGATGVFAAASDTCADPARRPQTCREEADDAMAAVVLMQEKYTQTISVGGAGRRLQSKTSVD